MRFETFERTAVRVARVACALAVSVSLAGFSMPVAPAAAKPAKSVAAVEKAATSQDRGKAGAKPTKDTGGSAKAATKAGQAVDEDAKDTSASSDKRIGKLSSRDKKKADRAKKNAEEKKRAREKAKLDAQADAIAGTLAGLAFKLENAAEDLIQLNGEIKSAEKDLKKAKKKLKRHKAMLAKSKKNVSEGAKAMYTDGGTRLMSVLLGATSFEDFASRMYLYQKITEEWQRVFAAHKRQAKRVKAESAKTKEKIDELEDMRIKAQAMGDAIADNIASQERQLAHLDKKMSKLVNKKTEKYLRSYSHAFSKANSAARAWYEGSDTASDSVKGSHPSIVKIAMRYLGVKYVWAGETPSGFDCSGLTMYCYRKIGISLPHSARMQYSCGTHVSKRALMPGDLVFFGQSVAGIHHVGIYIGGDKYLHAPNTGDVVKVSTFSARTDCVGATRPK